MKDRPCRYPVLNTIEEHREWINQLNDYIDKLENDIVIQKCAIARGDAKKNMAELVEYSDEYSDEDT